MASTTGRPFSRPTSLLLKTRCYLHTASLSWNEEWPSKDKQALQPSRWDAHLIEVNYCVDTRPEQQLVAS